MANLDQIAKHLLRNAGNDRNSNHGDIKMFLRSLSFSATLAGVLCSTALAQGTPQANVGTFCGTGAASVIRQLEQELRAASRNQNRVPEPSIAALYERCQPGDIIAISAEETGGIGSMCDFNKAVVRSADMVLCAYVGVRAER